MDQPKVAKNMRENRHLTPRERQVLDLLGRGKTSKEIAARLNVAPSTIASYRKSLCRKFDVGSAAELIHHATLNWIGLTIFPLERVLPLERMAKIMQM
jgi:DNA-binding CsgD family transcriptional regulator